MAKKNKAAAALGKLGGKARWQKTTKEQRSDELRRVARARWDQRKPE